MKKKLMEFRKWWNNERSKLSIKITQKDVSDFMDSRLADNNQSFKDKLHEIVYDQELSVSERMELVKKILAKNK